MVRYLVFIITIIPFFADAQSFYAVRRNRNLLVSFGTGIANYKGEMVNPGSFGKIKPNIAVGAEFYVTPRISTRAQLTWFQIAGDDRLANDDRVERNLHFRSNSFELVVTGAVNLTPMGQRYYQRSVLNFHGFAGAGLIRFNPKAEYQGKWIALAPLETEGVKYSRQQPILLAGLGARLKINPFFNLVVEGGYRLTFTDYLDDVSVKRYKDPATLKSDLSRALADRRRERDPNYPVQPGLGVRGNPESNDGYFIGNVTLQYYLPTEIFRNAQRKLYRMQRGNMQRRPKGR